MNFVVVQQSKLTTDPVISVIVLFWPVWEVVGKIVSNIDWEKDKSEKKNSNNNKMW